MVMQKRVWLLFMLGWGLVACGGGATPTAAPPDAAANEDDHADDMAMLELPQIEPVAVADGKLKVVASTSIVGDVVANVGGDAIDLTVLMAAGQDPHSYQPSAGDLTQVAEADIVFINGWDLEEGLVADLEAIAENAPIVAVNAGVVPLEIGAMDAAHGDEELGDEEHDHAGADPHTWLAVPNVMQWVDNVALVLETAVPALADTVNANAAAYKAALTELETYAVAQLATVPPAQRVLVTNHDSLAYFAAAYDFEILGTVIPGASTLAEPSANDLTELVAAMAAEGVCTVFTEATISDQLANTVAAELNACDSVAVVPLYTGAVGPAGSGADSYIGMFRANVDAIVAGLR